MLSVVVVLSIAANLSERFGFEDIISRKMLLILLAGTIFVALFHYLRLLLFIAILTLAIGANLPDEIAKASGISPLVMLVSLGLLVVVSVISYLFKLLPTGIENPKINTEESRKSVLTAVKKGDLVNLHRLIKYNTEINFTEDGTMPVFIAAENGYTDVMQILVHNGVNFNVQNAEGKTPNDIAISKGYTRISEILNHASDSSIQKQV